MNSKILQFFRDDEDIDPSFVRLTRNILFFVIAVNIALLPLVTGLIGEGSRNPRAFLALSITLMLEGISLYFVFRGRVTMAKFVVPLALIVAVTIIFLTPIRTMNAVPVNLKRLRKLHV